MTRVLIADDQALVRGGLRMIIEGQDDLEVVGEAEDGVDAVDQAAAVHPDIVLMDIRMPRMDGIDATRRILDQAKGATRVLVLTTFDQDEYVYEASSSRALRRPSSCTGSGRPWRGKRCLRPRSRAG